MGREGIFVIFTLVLAGILGPREFGVISIALVYISFLNMFQDQGLVAALIQKKDLEHGHADAVFWMNQCLSVVLVLTKHRNERMVGRQKPRPGSCKVHLGSITKYPH